VCAEPEAFLTFLLGQLGEDTMLAPNPAVTSFIDIAVRCVTLPAGKRPTADSIAEDLRLLRVAADASQ
jgi:hypothetical protein